MNSFFTILISLLAIWGIISLGALAVYKSGHADSWEDGLSHALAFCWKGIYDFFHESDYSEYTVNCSLFLSNQELTGLLECFEGHPYDTPVYDTPPVREQDILWFNIRAFGYVERYANLTFPQCRDMAVNIVQKYFCKIRELVAVPVYVDIAAPDKLLFAIPLSEAAQEILERRRHQNNSCGRGLPSSMLEEDIFVDIFEEGR